MSIEGQGHFFFHIFSRFLYVLCFTNVKISGERLQDQWSSGLTIKSPPYLAGIDIIQEVLIMVF